MDKIQKLNKVRNALKVSLNGLSTILDDTDGVSSEFVDEWLELSDVIMKTYLEVTREIKKELDKKIDETST